MNPELAKALLAVQQEAPKLQRDGINPHFGSEYVTLESLMQTVLPILNAHGVVLVQAPAEGVLVTRLIHADTGEVEAARTPLMLTKQDPQSQGSAITYARRYALMAMLGLAADADDDGNAARPSTQPTSAAGKQKAPTGNTAKAKTFDPGKQLAPGAIAVKSEDDATHLRLAQRDLAPDEDWVAVENHLAMAVFDAILPDLTPAQWGMFWKRLANAVAKAYENGDFPPPTREEIQAAYAWAFNGTVIELSSLVGPFEDTTEAGTPEPEKSEEKA